MHCLNREAPGRRLHARTNEVELKPEPEPQPQPELLHQRDTFGTFSEAERRPPATVPPAPDDAEVVVGYENAQQEADPSDCVERRDNTPASSSVTLSNVRTDHG